MDIKVVSLNTWHGGRIFEPMVQFLREQDADIVLLQEVLNAQDPALEPRFNCFTELPKLLGYKHAAFAPAFTWLQPEGAIQEGNAVLSKFPLKSFEPIFLMNRIAATTLIRRRITRPARAIYSTLKRRPQPGRFIYLTCKASGIWTAIM